MILPNEENIAVRAIGWIFIKQAFRLSKDPDFKVKRFKCFKPLPMFLFELPKNCFSKNFLVFIWGKCIFILAFIIWWNSQSLALQILIPSSAGLLLILSLIGCYCCCCRETGSRNEDVKRQPKVIIPTSILLQSLAENQFKYKPQVNEIA